MVHSKEKLVEIVCDGRTDNRLTRKRLSITILNMLKELKETMEKELMKTRRMTCQQIENINKEIKILQNNRKNLELNSTITEMKSSLERLYSRFELAEEKVSKLCNRTIESIQDEEQKKKE